jgi:hypothetical protein
MGLTSGRGRSRVDDTITGAVDGIGRFNGGAARLAVGVMSVRVGAPQPSARFGEPK